MHECPECGNEFTTGFPEQTLVSNRTEGACPKCGHVFVLVDNLTTEHSERLKQQKQQLDQLSEQQHEYTERRHPNTTINRPSDSLFEGLPLRFIDDDSDRIWFRYPSLKFIFNFNNVVGWIYGLVGTLACIGFLFIGLQQSGWVIPAAIGAWFLVVLMPTIAIFASTELLKIAVSCEVHLRDVSEQLKKK